MLNESGWRAAASRPRSALSGHQGGCGAADGHIAPTHVCATGAPLYRRFRTRALRAVSPSTPGTDDSH